MTAYSEIICLRLRFGSWGALFSDGFVRGYDPLNEVTHGNHTRYRSSVKHWKVTDVMIGHELHALINSCRWADAYHRISHDVPDERLLGRSAPQDDFACIVALGDESLELAAIENDQRPDARL